MTIDGFDLRGATLRIIAESGLLDPGEVAEKLIHEIPDDALRDAMVRTLRDYVRHILIDLREGHVKAKELPDTRPAVSGTWKRFSPRFQMSAYPVEPDRPWVPFLDLTVEQLEGIVAGYRRRAAELTAKSTRFEATLAALRAAGKSKVSQLPPAVLDSIWDVSEEDDE